MLRESAAGVIARRKVRHPHTVRHSRPGDEGQPQRKRGLTAQQAMRPLKRAPRGLNAYVASAMYFKYELIERDRHPSASFQGANVQTVLRPVTKRCGVECMI